MNLIKNLSKINKCPICKKKKIKKLSKINNVHPDLKNLFNLLECCNCKHWFISKMPTDNFLMKLYKSDSNYVMGDNHIKISKKHLNQKDLQDDHWIFKFMKNKKKGTYLEIGPGNCNLLRSFRNHGWHCEGLELSKWIKVKGVHHNINKLSKKNVNALVFHDVLEHTADPMSLLKKFNKQQKSGDKLFLAYPNASSFKAKIFGTSWLMVAPLGHLNFFSLKSTKILLEKTGYHPIFIKETSFVAPRKLIRSILRLPITITIDLINFDIKNLLNRIPEIFLNILDLLKGSEMHVIAVKK